MSDHRVLRRVGQRSFEDRGERKEAHTYHVVVIILHPRDNHALRI